MKPFFFFVSLVCYIINFTCTRFLHLIQRKFCGDGGPALIISGEIQKFTIELMLPELSEPRITSVVKWTQGEIVVVELAIVWRVNSNGNTALSFLFHVLYHLITICPSVTFKKIVKKLKFDL